MIRSLSLARLAQIHGGILINGEADFSSISIDSRTLKGGELFIAIRGPRFDGAQFIDAAVKSGVKALVVSEPYPACALPQWVVGDTTLALGQIGAAFRSDFAGTLVGITGSNGKTTVKELLASLFKERGEVLATRGNLNNQYGVPLMLSELSDSYQFAVLEMGASAEGEIGYLAGLCAPDVALVNNVGHAHLEGFGSRDGIMRGKGEIYSSLGSFGRAVINLDSYGSDYFINLVKAQSLTFSARGNSAADVRVSDIRIHQKGSVFSLNTPLGDIEVSQSLLGANNVSNAAAAATCALAAGMGLDEIRRGIGNAEAVQGRLFERCGAGGCRILDDAYNANPDSVKSAIDVLSNFGGSRILVLGTMGELGEGAPDFHREIGEYARAANLDSLIAVGPLAKLGAEAFGSNATCFNTNADAAAWCREIDAPGMTLLIKGSRSAHLEEVIESLTGGEEKICSIG